MTILTGNNSVQLSSVMEHEQFSESVTVRLGFQSNTTPAPVDPTVYYTVVRSGHTNGADVSIEGNVITISGAYNNNFQQSITYLDTDRIPRTVDRFDQLPEEYFIVSNYTAPAERTVTAEYAVYSHSLGAESSISSDIYVGSITQTVINNYTPGRDSLKAAVIKGQK